MFKKTILTAVFSLLAATSSMAAEMKIGVYNERLVMSKAPQMELIQDKLKKQFADKIAEIKALGEKGTKLQETYQRDSVTMTQDQKIKAGRELEQIDIELKTLQKQFKEDSQRAQQKELQKVAIEVQKAINKLAEAEGYDLVLRVEAVVFRKEYTDISNKIITIISNPAG